MICHYKKIVTVTVKPDLGGKHLDAYNSGLDEMLEEVDSEGAVLDIQPIKNQDGATLMYATIADMETGEMTLRDVNVISLDVNDVRSRIKR
jgi:hypothetical protein